MAAAAAPEAELAAVMRSQMKPGTIAHQEVVIRQFKAFLAERQPTPELYREFMLRDIKGKRSDGTPLYVPSSLWSRRSHLLFYFTNMLSPSLDVSSVDQPICNALAALQKNYVPNHARDFKASELFDFWARAENQGPWSLYKAISLVGFFGLARNSELVNITWEDIDVQPEGIWVLIHRVKCDADRKLCKILIPRCKGHRIVPADIFLSYRDAILSARLSSPRVFMQWRKRPGKWVNQPMGKESIRKVPGIVANYLFPGKNNAGFRGHSWRPSGATALAAYGGSVIQLQTAGGWRSVRVASTYVHESPAARKDIATTLCGEGSQQEVEEQATTAPQPLLPPPCKAPKIVFNGPVTSCTFIMPSNTV